MALPDLLVSKAAYSLKKKAKGKSACCVIYKDVTLAGKLFFPLFKAGTKRVDDAFSVNAVNNVHHNSFWIQRKFA